MAEQPNEVEETAAEAMSAAGTEDTVEDTAKEEVVKEEEVEGSSTSQSSGRFTRRQSLLVTVQSKSLSDEQEQLNPEEVKRTITFSPSITDAVHDVVTPMREVNIQAVPKDLDQSIIQKAIQRVREEFTENRAITELTKMYDLYKASLGNNSLMEQQCHDLQDKVRQYEARHLWDPRVLKVLLIAERYRQEKALVDDEKSDLEAEVIDMTIEMKHMEDMLKNKNKDIQKVQDELKKVKEIEKQVEHLETMLMRKDNEIHALHDNYDALLQTNFKLESQHHSTNAKMSIHITEDHQQQKTGVVERELMTRVEHLTSERAALRTEVEEKNKLIHIANRKMSSLQTENGELDNIRKEHLKSIAKMQSENNRLQNSCTRVEKKIAVVRDQLTIAKSDAVSLKKTLEGCLHNNTTVSFLLETEKKEVAASKRQVSSMQEKVVALKQDRKQCEESNNLLRQESQAKDRELNHEQRQLSDKKSECDALTNKLFKLETFKNRHVELIRLTRLNTTQMVKEISGLRNNLLIEKTAVAKAESAMVRMHGQIEALQREYLDVLDKNLLLVRNQEMASAAIEQFEMLQVNTTRRIAHLMKTNIDLYTQTTNQQEIALIQSHQFHLKENEIKGLLSRLEEEDHKMERMLCKDKEKRATIEQLHAEANSREEKIKTLKSIIESYCQLNKSLGDKAEELAKQLRAAHTQNELIRRQRDLFGTKLLQSQAETDMCQERLRVASATMTRSAADFYNMGNDLRILKLEIRNLRRKVKLSEGHTELIHTLRQELGQASKALELQKCKNVVLEQTRMPQVHRWRGLLASDPSKYEMVLKNQLLIRRLISKTKEVAKLEELLKQKDTNYLSLRVLVQRRMDTGLTPEMSNAKSVIRKQHRQLKALTAELNMASDDVSEAKARERVHQNKLNEMVLRHARDKVDRLRATKNKTEEFSRLGQLPPLPSGVTNYTTQ